MGEDERKMWWKPVRFDMPTFDVTMCGVLGGGCQRIERELGLGVGDAPLNSLC